MIAINHKFTSAKSDSSDATLIQPSNWNDTHNLSNFPILFVGEYNFTAQQPGGSLVIGSNTITLNPIPVGLAIGNSLYISGGTGTAEAVPITGWNSITGQVIVTCANTHSGAWVISSASAGIQEALESVSTFSYVFLAPGTYAVYAKINVNHNCIIQGSSYSTTVVQGQVAANGIFDCYATVRFDGLQITSLTQQTAGAYGIRLTANGGGSNSFSCVVNCYLSKLYDAVLAVNAGQFFVDKCFFVDFAQAGVVANDTNSPDYGGPTITNSNFSNFNIAPVALAGIYITSTGDITIANCGFNGSATQINYGIYLKSVVSSGLLICNDDFENMAAAGIYLSGTFTLVNISNNHFAQFGGVGNPNTYWGILLDDGTGVTGITDFTITGNVMLGTGAASSNSGIAIQGHSSRGNVVGNSLNGFGQGIYVASTCTGVVVGVNTIINGGTTVADLVGSASLLSVMTTPIVFAKLGTWANGSMAYVTDGQVTSGVDNTLASGGTGCLAVRINGAWRAFATQN